MHESGECYADLDVAPLGKRTTPEFPEQVSVDLSVRSRAERVVDVEVVGSHKRRCRSADDGQPFDDFGSRLRG